MFAFAGPLKDRVAIHELVAAYGDAISRLNVEEFGTLWAEDAVWVHPQVGTREGRGAIMQMCADAMKNYSQLVFTGALAALEIRGDHAAGRNYTSELVTDLKGATVRVTGRYDDEYVRRGGRWLFKRREFNLLHTG